MLADKLIASESQEVENFITDIQSLLDRGIRTILADVADANGADPQLMEALDKHQLLEKLSGFAAWNTAANTIGSALAQASLPLSSYAFCQRRIQDDWTYQSVIRPKLGTLLLEQGADIWNLTEQQLAQANDYLAGKYFLPWGRIFEVEQECAYA